MIGRMHFRDAPGDFSRFEAVIARDWSLVAGLHDRPGRFLMSVAIHHQPRIGLVDEHAVEAVGKSWTKPANADIPGNMASAVSGAQAQGAETFRNDVAGMIAEQKERGSSGFIIEQDGWRFARPEQGPQ